MRTRPILIVLIVSSFLPVSCHPDLKVKRTMKTLSQITFSESSGTILPELQYREDYIITPGSVIFKRSAYSEASSVNQGSWEVFSDPKSIEELFDALIKVDCSEIERIEPEDQPDGSMTVSYTLVGRKATLCTLYFDPGTTYKNGNWVTKPIQNFISGLIIPTEATIKYKD